MKKRQIYLLFLLWTALAGAQINTDRMMIIGRNALYFEDYVLSIQYFNQVIASKPYLAEPYFFRGAAKLYLGDYQGAENDCTEALERNGFMVRAYLCRAYARMHLDDFDGAVEDCEKGLEFDLENQPLMQNKAVALVSAKRYSEAETHLANYIRKFSGDVSGYMIRGQLRIEQGDTLAAVEDFSRAVSVDKHYAPAYAGRAYANLLQEAYSNALPDLDEAIRLDPENTNYYLNRGLARYHSNNLRGTLDDFDRVIELDPNHILAYFNRGLIRGQVGDMNRAIDDFDKVLWLDPKHHVAQYNRALMHEQVGQLREAMADLNVIIEAYPKFTPAMYQRSEIKRKLGDAVGADRDYFAAWNLDDKLKAEREDRRKNPDKYAEEDSIRYAEREEERKMERYNRVILAESSDRNLSRYDNPMRGRVQDQHVAFESEAAFGISFYDDRRPGPMRRALDVSERLNELRQQTSGASVGASGGASGGVSGMLYVSNGDHALDSVEVNRHFREIDRLSQDLENRRSDNDVEGLASMYFVRAVHYALVQDLNNALNDLDEAIALKPDFTLAYFQRAHLRYRRLHVEYAEKQQAQDEADDRDAFKINGLELGESVLGSDYERIVRDYDRVIELQPDFIYAWYNRGLIRGFQRDYRNALIDYTKALELNREFAEAWFNRGLTYLALGDRSKGSADLRLAGQFGLYKAYNLLKRWE